MLRGARKIHGCAHTRKFICLYLNYNYKGVKKKVFSEKNIKHSEYREYDAKLLQQCSLGFLEGEINIKSKCEKFNKKKC